MFKENNELKYKELFVNYHKKIYNFFLIKTKDHYLSQDLSSETITKVIKNYNENFDVKSLDSFVYKITNNHFNDYLRKKLAKKNQIILENTENVAFQQYVDYSHEFEVLIQIINEKINDEFLKSFFENKYINALTDKELQELYSLSEYKIEKTNELLIKTIKKIVPAHLFI